MRRDHRLRRRADFARVQAARKSWAHPLLVLAVCPREDGGALRLGVITGKRVGKAVIRNRVKRLIRESVRARLPEIESGHDIVVIARPLAAAASLPELAEALNSLLVRADLMRRPT